MKKVLVLCTGNSVRSQMAEAYLKFYAKGYGIFFSAGLQPQGINPYAARVMEEDNIDLNEYLSKSIDAFANIHFDYLLTVCPEAEAQIPDLFSYQQHLHFPVPDPAIFEGSEEDTRQHFLEVREMIKKNMLQFIGRCLMPQTEAEPLNG